MGKKSDCTFAVGVEMDTVLVKTSYSAQAEATPVLQGRSGDTDSMSCCQDIIGKDKTNPDLTLFLSPSLAIVPYRIAEQEPETGSLNRVSLLGTEMQ